MAKEVVILGGGFGGIRVAKTLSKWSEKHGNFLHITVIDKNRFHTYHPNLYEVSTAHIPEAFGHLKINFYDIKSSSAHPLDDIFVDNLNVSVNIGEATGVDFKGQKVFLQNTHPVEYDILVIAIGSETNYFNIPGLRERALPLKDFYDALEVRNAIDEQFARSPKNHLIKIVIGGGGFTGCEFASELMGYLKKLAVVHGRPEYFTECTIVEASNNLLGGAGAWVQKKAKARLEELGLKFKFGSPIKNIDDGNVVLEDGSKTPFDVLVWMAGVKANTLVRSFLGVKVEKGSCLAVDNYLRIIPYDNVFGVGDMTYCVDEATGKSLPMTAFVALREGKCVAHNIIRFTQKKQLKHCQMGRTAFVIPLGGKYALLEGFGIKMAGAFPWFLKHLIALHYWREILGWRKAWRVWRNSLKIFAGND